MELKKCIDVYREQIIRVRRDLHRIPEPAFKEKMASKTVVDFLENLDLPLERGIAEYCVVSLLKCKTQAHDEQHIINFILFVDEMLCFHIYSLQKAQ